MIAELETLYPGPPTLEPIHPPDASYENVEHTSGLHSSIQDILLLVGTAFTFVCPWMVFGLVWANQGIQMNDHLAKVVTSHPHATTYLITLICTVYSLIVSELFSLAIIRCAQELVTRRMPVKPFQLTVLLGFRHQTWPWGKSMKDARYLMTKNKWLPAASVIVCALTFPHLTSSAATLLTPISFNRTAILTGTELNFSSTDNACLAWFNATPLSKACDHQVYNGRGYAPCLRGSQTVDILEAGRGKVLESISNESERITLIQLGAGGGLHFQGNVQGVLPLGPNGVPAVNTSLKPFPFSNHTAMERTSSYDYTLNLQGLVSNVSCRYTPTYPFTFGVLGSGSNLGLQYNVSCTDRGEADVLTGVLSFFSPYSKNTLVYWACQSALNGTMTSYSIYLAGLNTYASRIGNITCNVNPIQTAIYPVTYRSTGNTFSIADSTTPSPLAFSALISHALKGLGAIVVDAQSLESNLFAESVLDLGLEFFGLPVRPPLPQYLRLYEQMIQGIIEYEITYLRLLYSTQVPDPPSSCLRTVTGLLNYEVLGWSLKIANVGFLIPMAIINVSALTSLLIAMWSARMSGYKGHPSRPRRVVYDIYVDEQERIPDEWMHQVSVRPTTAPREYINRDV